MGTAALQERQKKTRALLGKKNSFCTVQMYHCILDQQWPNKQPMLDVSLSVAECIILYTYTLYIYSYMCI